MNKPAIEEILERTTTGDPCTVKEWDVRRIPRAIRGKLEQYGLKGTCDPVNPVNTDGTLADRFFKAGYELALELGMLCETTERIVRISEDELQAALAEAPSELVVGVGAEASVLKSRTPSDPYPTQMGASLGITVTESLWPELAEGIARAKGVDMLEGGSLMTVNGYEVRPGTPFETRVGAIQGRMHRKAREAAGRPGMGGIGCISAVTEFGQFAYGIAGSYLPTDMSLILFPSELKVSYQVLNKVVHTLNVGGPIFAGSPAMIGGMPGPPEGAVLSCIACALLQYPVLHAHAGGGEIYDLRYLSNVNRDGLWALSVTHQALSRNTHILTHGIANEVSGPGTESLLYEALVGIGVIAASGASFTTGPRSAGGKLTDHLTPLECGFCGEVAHAASGLSLAKMNEIANAILPHYESHIKTPDVGKTYQETYDRATRQPLPEWQAAYEKVKKEAISLGMPL